MDPVGSLMVRARIKSQESQAWMQAVELPPVTERKNQPCWRSAGVESEQEGPKGNGPMSCGCDVRDAENGAEETAELVGGLATGGEASETVDEEEAGGGATEVGAGGSGKEAG